MAEARPLGAWVRPPGVTLAVWNPEAPQEPLFVHGGPWLHPLFALGEWLTARPDLDRGRLVLRDRVIGRAAAFLILDLGIVDAGADIVSRRALDLWGNDRRPLAAGQIVDRIDCRTEDWLAGVTDPAEALALLQERRRLSNASQPTSY